jgi:hypothetical protein
MRALYVKSRGRSQVAWSLLFRTLRPPGPSSASDLGLAAVVRARGFAVCPDFLDLDTAAAIRDYLHGRPGTETGRIRIDYDPELVLAAPGVAPLLEHPVLLGAARNYLGAQPIFTGIHAWASLHDAEANDAALSDAAQLFHFDCDWPRFIKFFIYLTSVTELDGPFAIIEGTHRRKPIWRDGRLSEGELFDEHGLRPAERRITGSAGTLIAADTSAFHRGTPVVIGPRLVLQLEYAVSRLGASGQYPPLPAGDRPRAGGRHTFDLFAKTPAVRSTG